MKKPKKYMVQHWIVTKPTQLVESYGPFLLEEAIRHQCILNDANRYGANVGGLERLSNWVWDARITEV